MSGVWRGRGIVLGVVSAAGGVLYGLSPSESGARPIQQIVIAVILFGVPEWGRTGWTGGETIEAENGG
ncbi:hypothetical protein SAMN02800687_1056 [Curtobacterium sp. UNCCL20]|nr:hypothetical protein SAMN02800687_1056 [Curtobacterium sp. UNCCL20]